MERESEERDIFTLAVQKGLAGDGYLHLSDGDLSGLTENMKSIWASRLGSAAIWRSSPYKVPVGKDAMNKVGCFCQNSATRARLFEAYYAGFPTETDEAALKLLRTRRELAKRLGFETWADYELRPLAVGNAASAHQLMDRCWRDAQPTLAPYVRRMEELGAVTGAALNPAAASRPAADRVASRIPHADEAFFRALVIREADTWKLSEYFPADRCLPKLLDTVGRAYNVNFHEVPSSTPRLLTGWHKSVRIYEVHDGAPVSGGASRRSGRRLGYVYLDLFQRQSFLGREQVELAGAMMLCKGHAYLSMHLQEPGYGQNKLFSPEEVVGISHELGHAVHMLCHTGSAQDLEDQPLDVLELPSTLAETIALQPAAMAQYAGHWQTGSSPPESLIRSCQRDIYFFVRYLQNAHVSLGLHSDAFDPHAATATDLRRASVALWQRYSPIVAHPMFTPLGEDAGLYVGHGATHVAYLLCYLRVDGILHGRGGGGGAASVRADEAARRWLSPQFAGQVRSQLLDRAFSGQRLATLLPPLQAGVVGADASGTPAPTAPPHPLPPLAASPSEMFARVKQLAMG